MTEIKIEADREEAVATTELRYERRGDSMKHPKRWQDCKPFVAALLARNYIGLVNANVPTLSLSDGLYLYMYELWQDGTVEGERS